MPVDNAVYDRMADSWWDERGFLHALAALNPARFGYMRRVLIEELQLAPVGLRVLDIGCGGGLLAEEFAQLGCAVVGVDPSEESLAVARMHAAGQGLAIGYHCATGEALPFADESFDIAYCCDVLEHVTDLPQVIAETARVLRPGGTYFYDTIDRTFQSRLIVIKLLQEWRWTALMPPRLHDWRMFVQPAELRREVVRHGADANAASSAMRPPCGRWTSARAATPPCPTSGTPARWGLIPVGRAESGSLSQRRTSRSWRPG
jgi:2-polyprenyl-6-hydroxyphenyl methylase / 3-demethylubiquinone-9 3-methyltransferase